VDDEPSDAHCHAEEFAHLMAVRIARSYWCNLPLALGERRKRKKGQSAMFFGEVRCPRHLRTGSSPWRRRSVSEGAKAKKSPVEGRQVILSKGIDPSIDVGCCK
jgi:hypothetical protein